MSANTVDYVSKSADTDRLWSRALWADCPWNDIQEGTKDFQGITWFDDFEKFPLVGTQTTEIAHGQYKVFNTGATKVAPVGSVNSVSMPGGILGFATDTDNDSASLAQSYPSFMLSGLASNSGELWFEVRVAVNTILTNTMGIFVGLAETNLWTLATGVPFNGSDAITNGAAAIGFRKGEDALGVWDTVVSDRATSFTNIGDDEVTSVAAFEWVKLGMRYSLDKANASLACVTFFKNGVPLATKITNAAVQAYTNLDANPLGFIMACIADSAGTTAIAYLDWVRIAQFLPTI